MPQRFSSQGSAYCPFDNAKTQLASPDAAAHLRQSTEKILANWMNITRRQGTRAQASSDASFLRNSLPGLLQNLADALEDPRWNYGTARNNDIARHHGRQRQSAHIYTVAEMIDEYAILRHVICESMLCEKPWPSEIIARIHAFIDAAIRMAAREFASRDTQDKLRSVTQQRDASHSKAATTQAELTETRQQRDDANEQRDAIRSDVVVLMEEKQVRERVVALLSHDLRSPLSSIIINAQRLERKPGDATLTSSVAPRVIRAANRIDRMIQDMLDAGRLHAGQGLPVALDAADLVQVATEAHEDYAFTHGLRVKLQVPKRACGTWDADALRRAVDNLVGNALKYGTHGTNVVIEVTDLPKTVRLAVHNQGNPLAEHELAGLFDPYVRTKSAEAGEQRGWGLGLTLVRGVVAAHGGEVGASSSTDAGTTFWFALPKLPPNSQDLV